MGGWTGGADGAATGTLAAAAVLLSAAGLAATAFLLPGLLKQMARTGFAAANFEGRTLPKAGGAIPVLVACASLAFWLGPAFVPGSVGRTAAAALIALLGFGFVGFLDDAVGDRSAGGLGGHWRRLRRGDVTTGALKATFGVVIAGAAASLLGPPGIGPAAWLLHVFLIAGFANGVNLFDVRPGRAMKVFFLAGSALWLLASRHPSWWALLPAAAPWAAFAPRDVAGRALLGDGGANGAGALLGVAAAATGGPAAKTVAAACLVALHVATERGSITEFIRRRPWLRRLDEWGRRGG